MALTANSSQSGAKTTILVGVIVLHIALFYAIQSGLTRKVIELLPQDIQTKIIEKEKPQEDIPPPPPPPDIPIEPPPFVPPPEVSIASAPVATNTITNVVTVPPPATPPPAPAPRQDVIETPKLDPKRAQRDLEEFYPPSSKRAGEEGSVVVEIFVQADGRIGEVKVSQSSGFPALDEGAVKYAKTWRLLPGKKNGVPEPMWYRVKVTFKIKK